MTDLTENDKALMRKIIREALSIAYQNVSAEQYDDPTIERRRQQVYERTVRDLTALEQKLLT